MPMPITRFYRRRTDKSMSHICVVFQVHFSQELREIPIHIYIRHEYEQDGGDDIRAD